MQDEQERRWSVVCVCVLFSIPPCIYSKEPRVRTCRTDLSNQWGGDMWQSWGGRAHSPGRSACPGLQPPPSSSGRLSWASSCLNAGACLVLTEFGLVLGLHLVQLCLNHRSDIFCDFMSGQSVLVTCILAWKPNLRILKGKVWFRDFIG